jgi:hypothetical protein
MRSMSLTTVTGRVRGTVRLKHDGAGARVVATSWASDRTFPRTVGAAVAFELEAEGGAVYRVDPFEALVALPVRETAVRAGVRHEAAWIAITDEITVEGELEHTRRSTPALRARRIAMAGSAVAPLHRVPPRTLQRAESERIEAEAETTTTTTTVVEAPTGEAAAEAPVRRKKKRPDPSGTPTPES